MSDFQTQEVFGAINEGNLRRLKQLVGLEGASLEGKNSLRYTPLMDAAYLEEGEIVAYILETLQKKYEAMKRPDMFLHYVNTFSLDGKTALMIATLNNTTTGVLEALVKAGANTYLKDNKQKTVFDYAPFAQAECVEDFWRYYVETDEIKEQQAFLDKLVPKKPQPVLKAKMGLTKTLKMPPPKPSNIIKI